MKRIRSIYLVVAFILGIIPGNAQSYLETDGCVSSDIIPNVQGLPVVREINGGTIFKILYVGNWTPEMKGAFEYACKIVSESLPPMLPITVKAEIGTGNFSNSLSKIYSITFQDFSNGYGNELSCAPQIKYVVLQEFEMNSCYQFFNSIKSVDFFENFAKPDIRIVYNQNRLSECSFNIGDSPSDKYDFVSVAIRDLFKGIGFSCGIRLNPSTGVLSGFNSVDKTAFDANVAAALAQPGNTPAGHATSGSVVLPLGFGTNRIVKLYAPVDWENGISLNYFIPDDNFNLTSTLTYAFGKGTVTRDVVDRDIILFRELLHWNPYQKSGNQPLSNGSGSTADIMPYNGSISVGFASNPVSAEEEISVETGQFAPSLREAGDVDMSKIQFIIDYLTPFHVFYREEKGVTGEDGWTVSVLKKDGTWDCVYYETQSSPELYIEADYLTFHYDDFEYARSCDGYLRCRATRSYRVSSGSTPRKYDVKYFVMDYLPQAVELGVSSLDGAGVSSLASTVPVRVGFKNLEGVTRLVLEVKPQGARVPNKIEVKDLTSGIADLQLTSGKVTTITPVSYNANGNTRGESLTVDLTDR